MAYPPPQPPQFQQPPSPGQFPPQGRQGRNPWLLGCVGCGTIAVVGFVAFVALAVIAAPTKPAPGRSHAAFASVTPSRTAVPPALAKLPKIGQTATAQGIQLKVDSLDTRNVPEGPIPPDLSGRYLIAITVTLTNTGVGDGLDVNPLYFKVRDDQGDVLDLDLGAVNGQLGIPNLDVGKSATGNLGFDVGKGRQPVELELEDAAGNLQLAVALSK